MRMWSQGHGYAPLWSGPRPRVVMCMVGWPLPLYHDSVYIIQSCGTHLSCQY